MRGRGHAPSGVPVLVGLGASHRVLFGGCVLVARISVTEVAAVMAFSNAESV